MACFVVPVTEAVVVTAAALILKKVEMNREIHIGAGEHTAQTTQQKTGFARKLFWLASLLWGGAGLLTFEHLWHGEVQPFFPFLTAATQGGAAVTDMLHEMSTVGVTMAVLVTAVWGVMVAVSYALEKRSAAESAEVSA